ncbi:MAG: hypothetical protein J6S52_03160 [Prevotella sp.]|nr:hypothetical protein [Prevotella sp.]
MKKTTLFIISVLMSAFVAISASAQNYTKDQMKQAKKEAKALEKQGWKVNPGSLSLYEQRLATDVIQKELDDKGMPKWVVGSGTSTGKVYNSARMQSSAVAKTDIAGKIEEEVAGLTETKLANDEISRESISAALTASKSRFLQKIGRVRTLMECYREKPDGSVEVQVTIAYPINDAHQKLKEAISESAESSMSKRLDEILGW